MAVFEEGMNAHIKVMSPNPNRALGAYIGNQLEKLGLDDGDTVEIVFDHQWFPWFTSPS